MTYRCPVCGSSDSNAYLTCNRSDCTDGRDPRALPAKPEDVRDGMKLDELETAIFSGLSDTVQDGPNAQVYTAQVIARRVRAILAKFPNLKTPEGT